MVVFSRRSILSALICSRYVSVRCCSCSPSPTLAHARSLSPSFFACARAYTSVYICTHARIRFYSNVKVRSKPREDYRKLLSFMHVHGHCQGPGERKASSRPIPSWPYAMTVPCFKLCESSSSRNGASRSKNALSNSVSLKAVGSSWRGEGADAGAGSGG